MLVIMVTEGSAEIGLGHVSRTLTLALQLREVGMRVDFVLVRAIPAAERLIGEAGFTCSSTPADTTGTPDRAELATRLRASGTGFVIVDTRDDNLPLTKAFVDPQYRLGVICDGAIDSFTVDLVVNNNLYAPSLARPVEPGSTVFLLGPEYALVRPEFTAHRTTAYDPDGPLLLTFGGSDPAGQTARWLTTLADWDQPGTVLVGSGHPDPQGIRHQAEALGWEVQVDPQEVAALMVSSGMVVSAAGITVSELACLGVPGGLVACADNQRSIAAEAARLGIFESFGWHAEHDAATLRPRLASLRSERQRRLAMSELARTIVDGGGGRRIAARIDRMMEK